MTINDLIYALEEMAEVYGEDTEVRFASQPSWPFEYSIAQVIAADVNQQDEEDDLMHPSEVEDDAQYVVFLAEGNQLGYLPSPAQAELGWSRR